MIAFNGWLGLLSAVTILFSARVSAESSSSSGISTECYEGTYADGRCNANNNRAECGYDSGDCCSCTCVDTEYYTCGGSGFACIDPNATCMDDDDITVDMLENCGWALGIGNGYCDQDNNKAECAYDGGDCCSCTCQYDDDSRCSEFACIDPAATCVDDDDVTAVMVENCSDVEDIGNGFCDLDNNKAECVYDGGDCCSCTCKVPETEWDDFFDDYYCSFFACIDPEAACAEDDDYTVDMVRNCNPRGMGNGYCDEQNNNELCNYDGGDCCECTCIPPENDNYSNYVGCSGGFACIDPEAACVNDDDITADIVANCDSVRVGNGNCDEGNNNVECGYDGGDCCKCTCEDRPNQMCGQNNGFACIDPEAACVNDDDITVDMLDLCGSVGDIGDGDCDQENNKAECDYDGGDCCECTCVRDEGTDDVADGRFSQCIDFACIDPDAACVDGDDITSNVVENCSGVNDIGNGYCNQDNNIAECGYDGGDCCECTCIGDENADDYPDGRYSQCNNFACIDPDAPCVTDDDVTSDMYENCIGVNSIGDGYCDPGNNKAECGWDGGDCCSCTCESKWDDEWSCSAYYGFDCKDTSAPCYGENPYLSTEEPMSYVFVDDSVPWEQEGSLPTLEGAVEVGTKTEVSVSATAYDVRPGALGGEPGCGEVGGDGCAPANTRDGISSESESRWSCAMELVEDEGPCVIEYTFGEPQDIMDIQVAFWKGDERTRTIDIHFDGVRIHNHESNAESDFNTIGVSGTGVASVALESMDLLPSEWISILEVLIFVTP
ncbi:unnamed protein product [Pylaiella littoralis]